MHDLECGAMPALRAALDPRAEGGLLYGPNSWMEFRGRAEVRPHGKGRDMALASRVWKLSEEMTGLDLSARLAEIAGRSFHVSGKRSISGRELPVHGRSHLHRARRRPHHHLRFLTPGDQGMIPQRERRTLSLFMPIVLMVGMTLWLIYGIYLQDLPIIFWNAVAIGLNCVLLLMKVRYGSKKKR